MLILVSLDISLVGLILSLIRLSQPGLSYHQPLDRLLTPKSSQQTRSISYHKSLSSNIDSTTMTTSEHDAEETFVYSPLTVASSLRLLTALSPQ